MSVCCFFKLGELGEELFFDGMMAGVAVTNAAAAAMQQHHPVAERRTAAQTAEKSEMLLSYFSHVKVLKSPTR